MAEISPAQRRARALHLSRRWLLQASCSAFLLACGGGGGGGGNPPPPPPGPFTVSGTVTAIATAAVDSDTNDPLQPGRALNDGVPTAQPLGNPAVVLGYVNRPGIGPNGPNFAAGDVWDVYRVDLTAGQVVELNFGDATTADVDLFVADTAGNILAESIGTSRRECIRIGTTGTYLVGVNAFSGFANYEVSWGPVSLGTTCPVSTLSQSFEPAFVPGQMLARPRATDVATTSVERVQAAVPLAGMEIAATTWSDGPVLLELAADSRTRALALRSMATRHAAAREIQQSVFDGATQQAELAYDTAVAIKRLRAGGRFDYVEHNGIVQAQQVGFGTWPPNDPLLPRMPQLDMIRLPDAFNALNALTPRPTYVPIVAVIDTGIVADHPDLTRMLVPGYDFVSDPNNGGDGNGIDANPDDSKPAAAAASFHGTHVAGTIAAETFNGVGVVGVAPMSRIMPVRVLGANGSGSFADIMQGMLFAAGLQNNSGTAPARRADVINMSLGGQAACPAAMRDTITQVRAQNVLIAIAAGNDSGAPVGTPANCPGAIAVSAIAYNRQLARYSNVGPEVVVTAPGGDQSRTAVNGPDEILSTHATFQTGTNARTPNYVGLQGTSMATPHIAGVLALMRAVNPNLSPAQVDALFAAGSLTDEVGAAGRDNQFGFGLINALKAVNAAGGGAAPPPPTGLPTFELSATRLDFGNAQTQLPITLTRINNSTDTPGTATDSAVNANAVTVAAAGGNPPNGPFTLLVTVDRSLLAVGEDLIQVELTTAQNRRLRFDVQVAPRTAPPVGLRGVGPVYVLALDPATGQTIAQDTVTATTPTYTYTLPNLNRAVVIVAGTDTDNDGLICGATEPCGAYPVLGPLPTLLSAGRTQVNFELVSGVTSAAVGASDARRGFARLR